MSKSEDKGKIGESAAPDLYTGEPPVESAHKAWSLVQKDLSYALGANVHRSWTARLHISAADAYTVSFSAPSRFIASKIENAYFEELQRLWNKHDLVIPPRKVMIAKPASQNGTSNKPAARAAQRIPANDPKPANSGFVKAETGGKADTSGRQDRFTFDNFVVGASNEFAYAALRQVSLQPEAQYNPIVIHGANGMGKTHLLYAAKQATESSRPEARVHKISGEQFVSKFVGSFRGAGGRDGIETFKASLRNVDVLMIDDAHFVTDKPGSREELLLTLIALISEGRQVVLTMDCHPDELDKASDRLKSYLTAGLVCKIGAADYEMRIRILDRLIANHKERANPNLTIPGPVRDHLAARIKATPRDLEGVFNQVVAKSEFLGQPITVDTIQETLSDSRYAAGQRLTVDRIQRVVAKACQISMDDMVSKRRARSIARPRQVAMYLCKRLTTRSLPDIGRRFGGRDHTTVMHAVKRITELRQSDPALHAQVQEIENLLR